MSSLAHLTCARKTPSALPCPVPSRARAPLRISSPGDAAEREADQAADRVARGERVSIAVAPAAPLARKCAECDEEDREAGVEVRRKPRGDEPAADRAPAAVAAALCSPGHPLDAADRAYFEPRFDASFADVRIHDDAAGAAAALAVGARAFALGRRIGFAAGEYAPGTSAGRHLIAHELAHVVQAKRGASPEVRRTAKSDSADIADCKDGDEEQVAAAARLAPPAATAVANVIMARPLNSRVEAALTRIFGPNAVKHSAVLARRLLIIAQGLRDVTYECEYDNDDCKNAYAYVWPAAALFGFGNIHICQPNYRLKTPLGQAATLIHEGAHRFFDADDEAGYGTDCQENEKTQALSDDDRLDNAASYSCLVQTVVQGGT